MTVVDLDPREIPGAMQTMLRRNLPGGALVEFEEAPVGWLAKNGEPRYKDHRAYYFTTPSCVCPACDGVRRLFDRSAKGRQCPACKGTGDGSKRSRLPSVTTLLDAICPKPGLAPWSEARGIEGTVEAFRRGLIRPGTTAERAVEIVRENRLGADRARDDAAERGLNVHALLQEYMETGRAPTVHGHPEAHHGYIQGLARWLVKADPEPVAVEQLVASPTLGYAGRLDLRARIGGRLVTVDLKTQANAGIYLAAHCQVSLYERAAVECGDPPADERLIVVVAENGEYRAMPADHDEAFTNAALEWLAQARPVDAACESANRAERAARMAA